VMTVSASGGRVFVRASIASARVNMTLYLPIN
jgi:hypothetical protein